MDSSLAPYRFEDVTSPYANPCSMGRRMTRSSLGGEALSNLPDRWNDTCLRPCALEALFICRRPSSSRVTGSEPSAPTFSSTTSLATHTCSEVLHRGSETVKSAPPCPHLSLVRSAYGLRPRRCAPGCGASRSHPVDRGNERCSGLAPNADLVMDAAGPDPTASCSPASAAPCPPASSHPLRIRIEEGPHERSLYQQGR